MSHTGERSKGHADAEITEDDITPQTATTATAQTVPEPVIAPPATTEVKKPIAAPKQGERRVSVDTGEMEWKDSKSPALGAAQEWKYELDTVLSSNCYSPSSSPDSNYKLLNKLLAFESTSLLQHAKKLLDPVDVCFCSTNTTHALSSGLQG